MSEDDDERMDRARRIRELREGGRRSGPDEQDAAEEASAQDDDDDSPEGNDGAGTAEPAASETPDDQATASEPAGDSDEPTPQDSNPTADDEQSGTDETNESADDGGTDTADDLDEPTEDTPDDASESDGALAAAQAAAAAASEFEGEGGVTMESDDAAEDPNEASSEEGEKEDTTAGAVQGAAVEETAEEETRVLEFRLGEELYCLDIEYVEEIVREETVTRVPNTPEYVSGVVDLRGQITTILDPKTAIGMERDGEDQLIVVFDAETFDDHGAIGWLVDEVNQVEPIAESDVKESPVQEHYINGVIERDDEFVIWTTPELALDVETDEE